MSEIFLSSATKRAVLVLRDTNLCHKRVCGKYSMQKSILKINKCRPFSTLESQYICFIPISCYSSWARGKIFSCLKGMQSRFLKNTKWILWLVSMSKPQIPVTAIVVFVWAAGDDVVLNCSANQQSFKIVQG